MSKLVHNLEQVKSVRAMYEWNRALSAKISAARFPAIPMRPYQLEFFYSFVNSPLFVIPLAKAGRRPANRTKRWYPIWCRRAGKDVMAFQCACAFAMAHPNVTVLYLFPELRQGADSVFEGEIDLSVSGMDNIKFADFMKNFARKDRQKSRFHLDNGSRIIFGSSMRYNMYRGMGPRLIVYSEFAYCHPEAESTFSPMLLSNGGGAIYPTTPNGRNFAYHAIRAARMQDPATPKQYRKRGRAWRGDCFVRIYPWYVLSDENGYAILSEEEIDAEVEKDSMTPEKKAQEFECAFNKAAVGAVYGREMELLRANGQIRPNIPINRSGQFMAAWDLGSQDDTGIWIVNEGADGGLSAVNYLHDNSRPLDYFIDMIRNWEQTYDLRIHRHYFPHDAKDRRIGIAINAKDMEQDSKNAAIVDLAKNGGLDPYVVKRPQRKADGIELVRRMLPKMYFDDHPEKCEYGVRSLDNYHRSISPQTGVVSENPVRDWSAHACDALQTLALGLAEERGDILNPSSGRTTGYKTIHGRLAGRGSAQDWMI